MKNTKQKQKKTQWRVFGWLNGDSYENQQTHDYTVTVLAANESEADDIGDKMITELYQKCDVIWSSNSN